MIRWRKIKVTPEQKVFLEYQVKRGKQWDDHTFQCSDMGLESFYDAFKALAEHVQEICELPEEDLIDLRLTVKGVTFTYGGERDTPGAVLTGSRKLKFSNTPLNLVTPHKTVEPYGEGQDEDMKVLQAEAERYLNGERQQVDLFNPQSETMETV
jgi:hypothetical protein